MEIYECSMFSLQADAGGVSLGKAESGAHLQANSHILRQWQTICS